MSIKKPNTLNEWLKQAGTIIIKLRDKEHLTWKVIAQQITPKRSEETCRNIYKRMKKGLK